MELAGKVQGGGGRTSASPDGLASPRKGSGLGKGVSARRGSSPDGGVWGVQSKERVGRGVT